MSRIHATAVISPDAVVSEEAEVGPWCVIESNVMIGPNCSLARNVTIGSGTSLGKGNTVYGGVTIHTGRIGDNNCALCAGGRAFRKDGWAEQSWVEAPRVLE